MDPSTLYRAGYVAIVGEPNVGKSTLLNALLNQKLSIVSARPQTTRQRVLGILSSDSAQIIFLDTPGLLRPKYLLHEKMVLSAQLALQDADVVLLLTEVSRGTGLPEVVEEAMSQLSAEKKLLLIINKVDTIQRQEVLPMIDHFARTGRFADVIPLSALKGENLPDLLWTIEGYLPVHPPFYPVDEVSEQPERFFAAELIREKIFQQFREEIPYSAAVEIVEFKERDRGKTFISADIIVERDSQKGIIIGKGGSALKTIGQHARTDIEKMVGHAVYLELHVKVRANWRENEALLRKFGYSKNDGL
jgi:GTP-binding protein Era